MKLARVLNRAGIMPDSAQYDILNECAIELIANLCEIADKGPQHLDDAGDEVGDHLQTRLMEIGARIGVDRFQWLTTLVNDAIFKEQSPRTPATLIKLDAFNLTPGSTFAWLDEVWTVVEMVDHPNSEMVGLMCRRSDLDDGPVKTTLKVLHYADKVDFVGIVRHPYDEDDNNWGQS